MEVSKMYLLTSEGVRERAIRIQVQINTDLNAGKTNVEESFLNLTE
jgi:hypothetical protein